MKYDLKSTVLSNNPVLSGNDNMHKSVDDSFDKNNIKFIIDNENRQKEQLDSIMSSITDDEAKLLEHLGDYTEEPYNIIESYFDGKHLERLVRHQLESYNNFVNYQIQRTIQMFNPVVIRSENDYNEQKNKYFLGGYSFRK
jgi:DNA-directed RNA polymerase beta subunit